MKMRWRQCYTSVINLFCSKICSHFYTSGTQKKSVQTARKKTTHCNIKDGTKRRNNKKWKNTNKQLKTRWNEFVTIWTNHILTHCDRKDKFIFHFVRLAFFFAATDERWLEPLPKTIFRCWQTCRWYAFLGAFFMAHFNYTDDVCHTFLQEI